MHLSGSLKPNFDAVYLPIHKLVFVLVILFINGCSTVQKTDSPIDKNLKVFTPEQLHEDQIFLDKSLREIHPEPFSRFKFEDYQQEYQQLYVDLSAPAYRHDFYQLVTPLVSKIADTHTRLLYPEHDYNQFLQQHGKFPLAVLNTKEGLIVVADQQEKAIVPIGAKLLSINGIDIDDILKKLRDYVPAETETGIQRIIQMEFSRLLWSVYQFKGDYSVDYLWQDNSISQQLISLKQEAITPHVSSHYGAITINKNTSVLWLNDFNESYDKFDQFLKQHFKKMKDADQQILILDLRYNQGGITDNLALLLSYLTPKTIHWANHGVLKLSESFRQQHSVLLSNAKNEKYGNYLDWLPVEYLNRLQWEILFASDGEWLKSEIKPVKSKKKSNFSGKIFALSNGYCFSACASLIAVLQDNQLATIIGESPGSRTDVQYGYPIDIVLPNTGLKVVIPAMKFIVDDSVGAELKNRNPDYQLERTSKDVLFGTDPVFDLSLELSRLP